MTLLIFNEIMKRPNLKGDQNFRLVGWEENCKGRSFVGGFGNTRSRTKSIGKGQM